MKRWVLKFASYKSPNDIFDKVRSGQKTIETRPRNPNSTKDYSNIQPGDMLVLVSLDTKEQIEKVVTFVHTYDSVEAMARNEDVQKILPGIDTPESLLAMYENVKKKWGHDYARKLEQYGIVAIGFK